LDIEISCIIDAFDSFKGVLDAVSYQEFDHAVEFRHNSWLDDSRKGDRS
jgi:hypothetical protein